MPTEKQILVSELNKYDWDLFTIKDLYKIHKTIYDTDTKQKQIREILNKIGEQL